VENEKNRIDEIIPTHTMKPSLFCILLIIVVALPLFAQSPHQNISDVYVDENGVMRWSESKREVSLFGVNYTTPFAYAYRAHKKLGLSLKQAIDLDVQQMARLGFDAFRVHVWDREISDSNGNVVRNEHLDLFDYLLARLAEHNIKSIVTPIAWWGNGWPEPDEEAPGFSKQYPRLELITNPRAREAERTYLKQFITHTNPYRKVDYKDDPSIVAIEILNEPTHPENGSEVTDYINDMAHVLRLAGCTKPIFYNISQNWSSVQAKAVAQSNVNGVSFQWYPTDLVHQKMLVGNYLLNVNKYTIPSENINGYLKKAKMVYEFDAADVGGSYLYPAIARSFREAGMQFATMFSYDPVQIAWSNTEYPTHFMNLLYTPSKAISLMIAGKAFHQLPRDTSYGDYPVNDRFLDFRVSYEEDLSEMNSDEEFMYSNTTSTHPKNFALLRHIAGCGSSLLVHYDGTGAYFLDKLEAGVWTLEVYPDVVWIRDPFQSTSMTQQVARLFWNERQIKIDIPELGNEWKLHSLSELKDTFDGQHVVRPGKYLVMKRDIDEKYIHKYMVQKDHFLEGIYLPPSLPPHIYVVNETTRYSNESNPSVFKFQIAGEQPVVAASLYIRRIGGRSFAKYPLKYNGGFHYDLLDSPKILQSGNLEYCVAVRSGEKEYTFPEGVEKTPDAWDFVSNTCWPLKILSADESLVLLDASRDRKDFVFPHYDRSRRYTVDFKNGSPSDETSLSLHINFQEESKTPFGIQLNVSENLRPFASQLETYTGVVLKTRSSNDSSCVLNLIFVLVDGRSYTSTPVHLSKNWQEIEIPLSAFHPGSSLILPNSYPLFLPTTWNGTTKGNDKGLTLSGLESIQIIANQAQGTKESDFEVVSVSLKK
jgi:hypothetical protein